MLMIPIATGNFQMGSQKAVDRSSEDDERPRHNVTIMRPFYLAAHKVTQAQFATIIGRNPSWFSATGGGKQKVVGIDTEREQFPVEGVSNFDAIEFCVVLSKQEGLQPCYEISHQPAYDRESETAAVKTLPDGTGYRLPSEAEWEYCARAGASVSYWFGDDESQLGEYAWFQGNSEARTHPVGEKQANPWGLFDMGGLLWEWCNDRWHTSYRGAPRDGSAWLPRTGGSGRVYWGGSWCNPSLCVVRGGSWRSSARFCRCAARLSYEPGGYGEVGFRVILAS
jgi:formylglycine-generating enzyme required for sulfatase activity